ncbi:MAG: hypothetical protein PHQ98_02390 [Candidatus ainarchaeum sp.]|nr:hypothetical protein [Candidatus ainarchaeum sp.]
MVDEKTVFEDEEIIEENDVDESIEDEKDEIVDSNSASDTTDDSKLPFPRATITKLVRKNVTVGKQIKGNVKDEMNIWVAEMVNRIATKMNSQPYTFVNYDMLKNSIAPYEEITDLENQKNELIKKFDKIQNECNEVISKIDSENRASKITIDLDSELPFPKATITNKLRSALDDGKTIKGPVKRGLNIWLGKIVLAVSKKMDTYQYPYIDRSMFKDAIEPYEAIAEIELEKERIIQQMESIKTACEILKSEINRKFKL